MPILHETDFEPDDNPIEDLGFTQSVASTPPWSGEDSPEPTPATISQEFGSAHGTVEEAVTQTYGHGTEDSESVHASAENTNMIDHPCPPLGPEVYEAGAMVKDSDPDESESGINRTEYPDADMQVTNESTAYDGNNIVVASRGKKRPPPNIHRNSASQSDGESVKKRKENDF
ncbi:hypothetical protein LTR86_001299 [Recurvomyces mirabilis]|nr:hypothetical protein LTR86_001299 [Recurvomyces mirabilis]